MTIEDKVKREIDFEHEWKKRMCPVLSSVIFDNNMGKSVLFRVSCFGSGCAHWTTTIVDNGKTRGVCTHK